MNRRIFSILLILAACYNPTEHATVADCGIVKLRLSDNSVAGVFTGLPDGRTLCSLGNTEFLVASGTGNLYRISSPEMQLNESFSVGYAGGAGYRSMILPVAGSVYLTSSAGDLLEIDLSENSVADQFPAGDVPENLASAPFSDEFFYVSDGSSGRISEVSVITNSVTRQSPSLGAIPSAITVESYLNSFLIAVSADENGLCGIYDLGTLHAEEVLLGYPCFDVTAFPAESVWAVTHPEWSSESGFISLCTNFSSPNVDQVQVQGHPMQICSVPGSTMFYLLSYLGNGESLIVGINYLTKQIECEVELSGFPWDITSHGNGEFVLALTSRL